MNVGELPDVHLSRVAVGSSSGVQRLFENSYTDMSSFLALSTEGWGEVTGQTDVHLITLDDYCRRAGIDRVDVLKTDTQGYDLEVLKGAERLFQARRISVVHVEVMFDDLYEGMPEFDELYRFLADRQMRLVALYNYVMRSGVAGWCDALFALPKKPIAEPPPSLPVGVGDEWTGR